MAREDTPLDQAVFDSTLAAELAKGSDRRVAEGRARSAAVRAYKAAHPEEAEAAPAPAPAAVAVATPVTTPVRTAPLPTGNIPTPKKGADDKHRLLALVPPEGIHRVEREQGDRVNVWPHLLMEE